MKALTTILFLPLLVALAACGGGAADPTPPDEKPELRVAVAPATATLDAGGTTTFSATVSGANDASVIWSVREGAAGGTIDGAGLYTAPVAGGSYTVVATSVADDTVSANATVTVRSVAVSLAPATASIDQGGSVQLVATVEGAADSSVSWSIEGGDSNGTVSAEGLYTAPNRSGSFTVVAASTLDPTKAAGAVIEVADVVLSVTPVAASIDQGATLQLAATLTGSSQTGIDWSVAGGNANGTIDDAGLYTAPFRAGTFTVIAASVAQPARTFAATVTVAQAALAVAPGTAALDQGATLQFSATATGTTDGAVAWSLEGGGSIDSTGLFNAPDAGGAVTVVATSTRDPSATASATVEISAQTLAVAPATAAVDQGGMVQLAATFSGTANAAAIWSVVGGVANGSVDAAGRYTAPFRAGSFTVLATSSTDGSVTASATIDVAQPMITVTPAGGDLDQGATRQFAATITGTTDSALVWSLQGGGAISPSGLFTAPFAAGPVTITATSAADPAASGSATVQVTAQTLTVAPPPSSVDQGATVQLTASLTGTVDTAVTWSVQGGAANGSVSSAGLYTAPFRAGAFTVVAASATDPSVTRSVTIQVAQPVITVTGPSGNLDQGATRQFSATITGTTDSALAWSVQGGAANGSVDSTGLYTAPFRAGSFTVIATSARDASATGNAQVTVRDVEVVVAPASVTLHQGQSTRFIATVTGVADVAVRWSASQGTIDDGGLYIAPAAAGSFTITATSVADPNRSATATAVVPVATGIAYVNPASNDWRLVRNDADSTPDRLVLDLVGPAGGSGRGIDLALDLDAARTTWRPVVDGDSALVRNRGFALGTGPQLLAGHADGSTLRIGVFQKGRSEPPASTGGPLLSVAIELAGAGGLPAGTQLPLSIAKANLLQAAGSLLPIGVQVGSLIAE